MSDGVLGEAAAGLLGDFVFCGWLCEQGDVCEAGIDGDGGGLVHVAIECEPHFGEFGVGAGFALPAVSGDGNVIPIQGAGVFIDGVDADVWLVGGWCLVMQVGDEQGAGVAAGAEALDGWEELGECFEGDVFVASSDA